MPEFSLSDPALAEILSGRRPWPTEQELPTMAENKPKTLAGKSPAAPETPPALGTEELPDGRVLQTAPAPAGDLPGQTYTPPSDVFEETADGRVIQVASAGVPIPIAQARQLGLIKAGPPPAHETKDAAATAESGGDGAKE